MTQTTLADHGATGQTSLAGIDHETDTTDQGDDLPPAVGPWQPVQTYRADIVARWEHDTHPHAVGVMRVHSDDGMVWEVHAIDESNERTTASVVETASSEAAALGAATAHMQG